MLTAISYLLLLLAVTFNRARAQGPPPPPPPPDNRCFLENGGSAESFFVSEDFPVGSTVGQLRIHGDPRPVIGNIALRLKETDSPVDIPTGTRNLTLRRRLDKEGRDGPSSVYVNVICDRLHTNDPGFVIPINIRVTDINDNAPRFINAPYILNISEVTVVGTRVLQGVRAEDDDQQGPYSTVRYSVLPGPHSDFFVFENDLEGTLVLRQPLDYETLSSFTVGIRAQDQGTPPQITDTILHVNVVDADDQNPRFLDERYTAYLPDPPSKGSILRTLPRDILAYDQDSGIKAPIFYSFNSIGIDYRVFDIARETGKVSLKRDVQIDELQQPVTLVIRATQEDNPDRYALTTLTVSRITSATRDIRFLQRVFQVSAREDLPGGSIIANLSTNHPRDDLRYYVSDQHLLEVFTIDSTGELALRKQLDYETRESYVFKVFVTDGRTNDSAVVNVSVLNVNDWEPRFRYLQYDFFVSPGSTDETSSIGQLVGRVEAADGDKGDTVTLSLRGPNASMFSINSLGEIRMLYPTSLGIPSSSTPIHLTAVATDSLTPQRSTAVPVYVHFTPRQGAHLEAAWAADNGGLLLVLVFSALLVLLALVIAALVLYICKVRRPKSRSKVRSEFLDAEKPKLVGNGPSKIENPMYASRDALQNSVASAMGGIPSDTYTATVKSIMSRNGTVRANPAKIASPKIHPAPQPPRPATSVNSLMASQNNLSEGGSGSSSSKQMQMQMQPQPSWPATIPTRVKKLSWGDDSQNKTDTDSIENVNNIDTANLDPVHRIIDNSNLTVYF